MPKSVTEIADECIERLRSDGKDVITFSWPDFYKLAERQRMKPAFLDELVTALRQRSLLLAQGQSAVLVAKDFNFAPVK